MVAPWIAALKPTTGCFPERAKTPTHRNHLVIRNTRNPGGVAMRVANLWTAIALCSATAISVTPGLAQVPDHPLITEIFTNPPGADGPNGRNLDNPNQEFIEIYLPTAAQLRPGLNKDNLRLTFYEIEGDSNNSLRGHVNQRIDLRPFDLDPSNGITSGAIARPSSGVVILAWVDYSYESQPPEDLGGTPATRVALINGGIITPPAGTVVVAMNGAQFSGTTNFPVPAGESFIDVPDEDVSGIFSNGSNVYLLVNRDDPGYVSLADSAHPEFGSSFANLPVGSVLQLSCLLDALAGNDDSNFAVTEQPYTPPTGMNIDLEDILPAGGVFTNWTAQIPEGGDGFVRRFVDVPKSTEDGIPGNENPATDAQAAYIGTLNQSGPIFPTPGAVVFATSQPKLSVALCNRHMFQVLANTTGRPGMICANVGGNYPINISATPGISSNPAIATFGASDPATNVLGQTTVFPQVAITVPAASPDGAVVTASLTFNAANVNGGDPPVQNSLGFSTAQATILNPTRGLDQFTAPFEATVFLAVQGLGADAAVLNEFVGSSLGTFAASHRGREAQEALGHLSVLLNSSIDLQNYATVSPLVVPFPATEAEFINVQSPAGTPDLATKVRSCAKRASGSTTYDASLNASETAVKAIAIPIPETFTKNGLFAASERLFFADELGDLGSLRTGLSNVTTSRTFELALIETNVTSTAIESGDSDDFGLLVQVGRTRPGASVLPGQFIFLSYSGGLEGEDIDTVNAPGVNATNLILLDLDNLDNVLGCQTITRLFLVDAGASGRLNVIEVLSLASSACPGDVDGDRDADLADLAQLLAHFGTLSGATRTDGDLDADGDVDLADLAALLSSFGSTC